jgi:sortase A
MVDKRLIEQLTLEELEQALMIKRRQLSRERLRQLAAEGRVVDQSPLLVEETASPSLDVLAAGHVSRRFRASSLHPLPDDSATPSRGKRRTDPKPRRSIRDHLLLGIELLALAGLLTILVSSYDSLRTLNQEVSMARAAPQEVIAPTPTPLVNFDRLPGGHTAPDSAGGTAPDVPLHLQQWVQPGPPQPVPTPGVSQATRIVIPAIGVDAAVVEGVAWEDLKKGVGHLPGSAHPGERGNMYLAAHNDIFGEIFRHLEDLEL